MSSKGSGDPSRASAAAVPSPKPAKIQLTTARLNEKLKKNKLAEQAKRDEQIKKQERRAKRQIVVKADAEEGQGADQMDNDGDDGIMFEKPVGPRRSSESKPRKPKKSRTESTDGEELPGDVDLLRDADLIWYELLAQLAPIPNSDGKKSNVPTDDVQILEKKRGALALYEDLAKQFDKSALSLVL